MNLTSETVLTVPELAPGMRRDFQPLPSVCHFLAVSFSPSLLLVCVVYRISFSPVSKSANPVTLSATPRGWDATTTVLPYGLLLSPSLLTPIPILVSHSRSPPLLHFSALSARQPSSSLPLFRPVHRSSLTLACLRPSFLLFFLLFFLLCPSFPFRCLFPCQLPLASFVQPTPTSTLLAVSPHSLVTDFSIPINLVSGR